MQMRKQVLAGETTYPHWGWPPESWLHTPGLEANPHLPAGQAETYPGWDSSSIRQGNYPKNIENCFPVCEMGIVLMTHYLLVRNKQFNAGEVDTRLVLCKGSLSKLSLFAHFGLCSLYMLTLTHFQPHHFIHKPFLSGWIFNAPQTSSLYLSVLVVFPKISSVWSNFQGLESKCELVHHNQSPCPLFHHLLFP